MGLIKEKEEDILTKERRQEISASVNRLMRIRRIRNIKKLKTWLRCHTN